MYHEWRNVEFDESSIATKRITRESAQALPKNSCARPGSIRGPSAPLVHVPQRAAPPGQEEGDSASPTEATTKLEPQQLLQDNPRVQSTAATGHVEDPQRVDIQLLDLGKI